MVMKLLTISPFGPFCPCEVKKKSLAKKKSPFSLIFLGSTNHSILYILCNYGNNSEFITIISIIIITIIILFIAKMTNYQLLPNNLVQGFGGSKPVRASITQTFVRNEAKLTGFPSKPMGPWKKKSGRTDWRHCEGTKQLQFSCLD